MTDRDVYSLIERAIRDGKRRIGEGDRQLIGPILAAYQDARNTIAAELYMLEQQILWSIEAGQEHLTEAWVRRQAFYERLDATIIREAERLEAVVRQATIDGMALGAAEGTVTGGATLRAIPWATIPPNVLTQWTAAVTPGSPVDRVLRGYGATVETSLRTEITRGLIQKRGSSNIVRTIMNDVGDYIPESNASRIVRTETMRAYRGVYKEQMDAIPRQMIAGYRWVAGMDLRTCPICLGLHGQIFKEYPGYFHVNCFPEGTVVNGPSARAATKRWYEGKLIEITTASNQRLSVTPNHPILTSRGWVGAGEIVEGDDVFRHVNPQGPTAAINPDHERRPALIEEVSETLVDSGEGVSRHVPGSPVDFHGDGAYGEVNVVFADGLLGDASDAAIFKPLLDEEFIGRGIGEILLSSLGASHQILVRALRASHGIMGRAGEGLSLLGAGLGHACVHGFGSVAYLNASLNQLHPNAVSENTELFGNGLLRHTGLVPVGDFISSGRELGPAAKTSLSGAERLTFFGGSHSNAPLLKDAPEPLGGDFEVGNAVIERLSGEIVSDEVIHLSVREFSGHVYNLQTSEGWYSANNIITHNCRCSAVPVFSDRYAPPRHMETGEEWLRKQPEDVQRERLGPGRYELWKDGTPLPAMIRFENDPVWGGTSRLIPLRELQP